MLHRIWSALEWLTQPVLHRRDFLIQLYTALALTALIVGLSMGWFNR